MHFNHMSGYTAPLNRNKAQTDRAILQSSNLLQRLAQSKFSSLTACRKFDYHGLLHVITKGSMAAVENRFSCAGDTGTSGTQA